MGMRFVRAFCADGTACAKTPEGRKHGKVCGKVEVAT